MVVDQRGCVDYQARCLETLSLSFSLRSAQSSFSRRRLFGSDYPVRKGWEMPPLSVFLSMQLRYRNITPLVPARIAESSPCR